MGKGWGRGHNDFRLCLKLLSLPEETSQRRRAKTQNTQHEPGDEHNYYQGDPTQNDGDNGLHPLKVQGFLGRYEPGNHHQYRSNHHDRS